MKSRFYPFSRELVNRYLDHLRVNGNGITVAIILDGLGVKLNPDCFESILTN
jgi:hypothetical protein